MLNNAGDANEGLPENQERPGWRGNRPESWSWYPVVGVVGGIAGAAIVEAFGHLSAAQSWTTVGLIATLTGVLAALLGVIIAFVVAFQWLVFDRRVDRRVEEHRRKLETSLQQYVRHRVQAIGELAIAWTQPIYERERVAKRILQFAPDTPNLAPLMAWTYLQEMPPRGYQPQRPSITPEMLENTRHEVLENASRWAMQALETRQYHDFGFPEWVMTLVCAWQKQSTRVLEYLPSAIRAGFISHEDLVSDQSDEAWTILTGCTHGNEKLLDPVLGVLGFTRPTWPDVKAHCENLDRWSRVAFWAILRDSGNAERVIIEREKSSAGEVFVILGRLGFDSRKPSINDLIAVLRTQYIPTRLILGDYRMYVANVPD